MTRAAIYTSVTIFIFENKFFYKLISDAFKID